jgi:hypothetical protein
MAALLHPVELESNRPKFQQIPSLESRNRTTPSQPAKMSPSLQTILLATLCILPTTLLALPIVGDTQIDRNGIVRPHTLITRDLQPVVVLLDNRALGGLVPTGDSSASGSTGSSAAATGLTGTSGASESASEGTSSSSSTSCREFLCSPATLSSQTLGLLIE